MQFIKGIPAHPSRRTFVDHLHSYSKAAVAFGNLAPIASNPIQALTLPPGTALSDRCGRSAKTWYGPVPLAVGHARKPPRDPKPVKLNLPGPPVVAVLFW